MDDIDSSPALPDSNPRKRPAPDEDSPLKKPLNLTGTQFVLPTPPDTDQSSNASPTCNHNDSNARQVSPAPSSSALSSVESISSNPGHQTQNMAATVSGTATASNSGQPPPKKKRKLTPAEKEQQQKEKDAKAAEKAAEKAKKDEEKAEQRAKKDEEKRVKDEERRRKAEEVEAKKREKELEKERREQEKLKKERAQMRLGVWFQKPATPIKDPVDGEDTVNSGAARRRSLSLSLEPFDAVADQIRRSESPCKTSATPKPGSKTTTPAKRSVSDYNKYFLPFQLQSYCSMPPLELPEDVEAAQDAFDHCVNDSSLREKYDLGIVDSYASLELQFAKERDTSRGHPLPDLRQLADHIQGTLRQPIDLTRDEEPQNALDALQAVSRRYLQFQEDVRPAYFGTYTKIRSPRTSRRISRNPFSRSRTDTDYDYDSEAEWEEPEEGEEIGDDEEDEAESVGDAHEMDEFLDDEDDALKSKRKMITGDLVPASTGLCWEDEYGKIRPSIEAASPYQAMRGMRIGVLLPNFSGATIDPFSSAYWDVDTSTAPSSVPVALQPQAIPTTLENGRMPPPTRAPLQPRPANNNATLDHMLVGAAQGMKGPIKSVAATQGSKPGRKPAPKSLSKEDLDEFKEAVVGSQVSKADLLKGLKARFPKLTNETIKSTLGDHFAQIGASKADKKWVFVTTDS